LGVDGRTAGTDRITAQGKLGTDRTTSNPTARRNNAACLSHEEFSQDRIHNDGAKHKERLHKESGTVSE